MKLFISSSVIIFFVAHIGAANPQLPTSLGIYLTGVIQIGRTITYSGGMSYDNDVLDGGLTPKWKWDFDYKSSTFTEDAITTNYLVSHIYDQPGTYTVAVIYLDDDNQQGNTHTFTMTIGDGGVSVFEMQPNVVSQSNYFLSKESHINFTSSDPNFTNQVTYTDINGFADVTSSNGWTYGSGVTFDTIVSAEPVIRMGAPQWTELRRPAGTGNVIARVDFYPDNTTGGTPHVIGFDGSSYRFCVQYNYSIDKFQIQKSDYSVFDTFALNAPPNYWYTVEVEKGTDGKCVAWVYPRGESRNYSDTKQLSGYPESWTCTAFSQSNDDYFYLTNYYVGSYSQSSVYTDGTGRTLQSQARDGLYDIVSAVSYDIEGRQNKSYRSFSATTTHAYYSSVTTPYNEVTYYPDPLNRVQFTKPAGTSIEDEWIKNRDTVGSIGGILYNCSDAISRVGSSSGTPKMVRRKYVDKLGRVIRSSAFNYTTGVEDIFDSTVYNMLGLPTAHYDPLKYQTTTVYDFLGRMKEQTTVDGGHSEYMYDKANRLRFMLDAEGVAKSPDNTLYWKYDVLGRVVEKGYKSQDGSYFVAEVDNQSYPTTPPTWRKKYIYDGTGAMLFTKNRLVKVETNNDNDSTAEVIETFEYDKDGNVLAVQTKTIDFDLNSYSTLYSYDHLGRVKNIQYPSYPTEAVIQDNTVSAPNVFTSQSISTLVAGPSFTVQSGATATLQAASSVKLVPGFKASGGSFFIARIGSVSNNLMVVKYTYNQLGQIASIGNGNDADYYASYTYNAEGKITEEKTNNLGSTKSFYYSSARGFLDSTKHANFNEKFGYSGYYNGSIASANYTYSGSGAPATYGYTFAYDKYNRMISGVNSVGGTANDIAVGSYDGNGKVVTRTMGSTGQTFNYYSGKNRLQNVNGGGDKLLYDETGNLKTNIYKGMALAYDPFTMMTSSITMGTTTDNFQYDGKKERILKTTTVGATKTSTLYLRGTADYPITEKIGTGTTATDRYYIYGPTGTIAIKEGSSTNFIVKDHLGSTRVVLNSGNQAISWYDYNPYGTIWRSTVNTDVSYKFTGQEYDKEIGLNNYRARMYDDTLNIFYAVDAASQTFSPYGYAGNNPLTFSDKSGDTLDFTWYMQQDPKTFVTLMNDLKNKTGLVFGFNNGKLSYAKENGKAAILTNAEGKQIGSDKARDLLITAIDGEKTIPIFRTNDNSDEGSAYVIPDPKEKSELYPDGYIRINGDQISNFISGTSNDLDNSTLGHAMTFMHEIGHTPLGGSLNDPARNNVLSQPGEVEDKIMNPIRDELTKSTGNNFGQRLMYAALKTNSGSYLAFSLQSKMLINSNLVPSSSYIKIK